MRSSPPGSAKERLPACRTHSSVWGPASPPTHVDTEYRKRSRTSQLTHSCTGTQTLYTHPPRPVTSTQSTNSANTSSWIRLGTQERTAPFNGHNPPSISYTYISAYRMPAYTLRLLAHSTPAYTERVLRLVRVTDLKLYMITIVLVQADVLTIAPQTSNSTPIKRRCHGI